ncbi:MAG: DUF1559 domain-containing protein [Planctomycetaceae bacterium]|nr:DUF1559 domain-containing protein [Planctomycetaceae bacterium]
MNVAPANPGEFAYRVAEPVNQLRESLKQLGLAMHNYHDVHNSFPAAATYGPDGQPLLSWRVALLPYLGHTALYQKFKQDEPWDSPHNLALLEQMPAVFDLASLGSQARGETYFQVFTGPGTVFSGKDGLSMREIPDGTSNTLMIVEGATPVPWSKPADLAYDPQSPVPPVGGVTPDGFYVALFDGSTRMMSKATTQETLRAMVTANGGEPINW